MSSANPPSLTALPPHLVLAIAASLRLDDLVRLRSVSHYFVDTIPAPTHAELLTAEVEDWAVAQDLYTCSGCFRLRGEWSFHGLMVEDPNWNSSMDSSVGCKGYPFMNWSGSFAHMRVCNDCGMRPLPGSFRYELGAHWYDWADKRKMVRCKLCEKDCEPPGQVEIGLCASCYSTEEQGLRRLDNQERPSLTTLPFELLLAVDANLRLDDLVRLRRVSYFFKATIPAPAHADLLAT